MEIYLRIDINLVAVILLGSVYFVGRRYLNTEERLNKAFLHVSLIIILELLLETATCIINKRPEHWFIPISVILHNCLFLTAPILSYFGYVLIEALALPYKVISIREKVLLWIPIFVNGILTISSPVTHYVFYIDKMNVYHRGSFFYLFTLITYFYFFMGFLAIIKNKKSIISHEFIPLMVYVLLPMIGGVVQALFYGTLLMWSSAAFTMIIIYILLQQRMVRIDDLTGVWSRSSFDYYIANRLRHCKDKKMGIIYCDIDDLKGINDKYGHKEGDVAISTSTELIMKSIRKQDIVVRMGGDEFIILLECETNEILQKTMKRLEQAFIHYNENNPKDYVLGCSFGADFFDSSEASVEQFLHHVDSLMYQNKRIKKSKGNLSGYII